jgi:RNA polymerase sigma-70 factor (ECF subfamily)
MHDRSSAAEAVTTKLERDEVRDAVRSALGRLPDRQRQAVWLRRHENMSYAEIAAAMGSTVPAVESLLSRAMAALKAELSRSEVSR